MDLHEAIQWGNGQYIKAAIKELQKKLEVEQKQVLLQKDEHGWSIVFACGHYCPEALPDILKALTVLAIDDHKQLFDDFYKIQPELDDYVKQLLVNDSLVLP